MCGYDSPARHGNRRRDQVSRVDVVLRCRRDRCSPWPRSLHADPSPPTDRRPARRASSSSPTSSSSSRRQSDILAEDYVTAIDEKNQLDAEVAAAEQRSPSKEAAVDALRGELAEVAVQAYMGAGTNGLGPMFNDSSTSPTTCSATSWPGSR